MKNLERLLKAFANRRRLAIIKYLNKQGQANVGDIAEHINLSYKATSKHLGVLFAADVVEKDQRSLEMWYRLPSEPHPLSKFISNSLE